MTKNISTNIKKAQKVASPISPLLLKKENKLNSKRIKKKDKYWTKEKLLDINDDLTKEFLEIFLNHRDHKDPNSGPSTPVRDNSNNIDSNNESSVVSLYDSKNSISTDNSNMQSTGNENSGVNDISKNSLNNSNNNKNSLKDDLLNFINAYNDVPMKGTNYSKIFMEIILNAFLFPEFVDIRDWIEAHFKITSDSYSSRFKREYDYFSTTGYITSKKTCDKPRDIKIRIIHQKFPDDAYKLGISFNLEEKDLINLDEFDRLYESRSRNKIGGTSTYNYKFVKDNLKKEELLKKTIYYDDLKQISNKMASELTHLTVTNISDDITSLDKFLYQIVNNYKFEEINNILKNAKLLTCLTLDFDSNVLLPYDFWDNIKRLKNLKKLFLWDVGNAQDNSEYINKTSTEILLENVEIFHYSFAKKDDGSNLIQNIKNDDKIKTENLINALFNSLRLPKLTLFGLIGSGINDETLAKFLIKNGRNIIRMDLSRSYNLKLEFSNIPNFVFREYVNNMKSLDLTECDFIKINRDNYTMDLDYQSKNILINILMKKKCNYDIIPANQESKDRFLLVEKNSMNDSNEPESNLVAFVNKQDNPIMIYEKNNEIQLLNEYYRSQQQELGSLSCERRYSCSIHAKSLMFKNPLSHLKERNPFITALNLYGLTKDLTEEDWEVFLRNTIFLKHLCIEYRSVSYKFHENLGENMWKAIIKLNDDEYQLNAVNNISSLWIYNSPVPKFSQFYNPNYNSVINFQCLKTFRIRKMIMNNSELDLFGKIINCPVLETFEISFNKILSLSNESYDTSKNIILSVITSSKRLNSIILSDNHIAKITKDIKDYVHCIENNIIVLDNLYKHIKKIKDPNNIKSLMNDAENKINNNFDKESDRNAQKSAEIISEINSMKLLDKLILYKHIFDYNNI
ncbi:hypothetical protein BCR32DRAFT_265522 [Anaeromyces robustus]|uniref:RNI-like protein n=1 Tax=Anaeromyces robustus TaxID=1754192 RepID=A0A1Y1XIU8_9FUNG|nr:hypothetical protein BCR32DRAFT_265522 [Anaeromyces robustus]|eukprot:ORX85677.1 hypothetical protein BCR32DRAFT_265522 [Anaeromyces robustus]